MKMDRIYTLGPSVQVREEDTGLLFYCSKGPRLYFLNSGRLVAPDYFNSDLTLAQWIETRHAADPERFGQLADAMEDLVRKAVLVC